MSTDDVAYLARDRELEAAWALSRGSEKLVNVPTQEPVTIDTVKGHLRIDVDDDNALLERYLKAARRSLENELHHAFFTQTWDYALDEPPCYSAAILLPRAPVQSVTSVTSYDTSNTPTVFSSSSYFVDTVGQPGRVALNTGFTWPAPSNGLRDTNAIIVRYVCGYTAPELVPEDLVAALLLWTAGLYQRREPVSAERLYAIPEYIECLVSDYRLVRV